MLVVRLVDKTYINSACPNMALKIRVVELGDMQVGFFLC
jgi:hypothetical protein